MTAGPTRRAAAAGLLGLAATPALAQPAQRRLYFLSRAGVITAGLDGANVRTLATGRGGGINDGIDYDPKGGRFFWTNMGRPNADDGFIQSVRLDGSDLRMVVPPGGTFTPKQLKVVGDKLYWSDREGMRVMRANLDGSGIETLVQTGRADADQGDASRWCVGVAVDPVGRHVYWTQKGGDNAGQGSIRRAGLDLPPGQTPATRTDIEELFGRLPEPIDLEIDAAGRRLYWTDRGDNTISVAPLEASGRRSPDRRILARGLKEAIGLTLDRAGGRIFYTALGGEVGVVPLGGGEPRILLANQGPATGIVLAP